jgi:hypothetical protein
MSNEGMVSFFTDLGLNLENCETMLAVYILGWSSFLRVTKVEFDKAISQYKTIQGISRTVRNEIQSKFAVCVQYPLLTILIG